MESKSYRRQWVDEREQLLHRAQQRAHVALGSYPVALLKRETTRLFGCGVNHMTTAQLHLFLAWLTALNVLTWGDKAAKRAPRGL